MVAVFQYRWIISVKCKDHSSLRIIDLCFVADNPEDQCLLLNELCSTSQSLLNGEV